MQTHGRKSARNTETSMFLFSLYKGIQFKKEKRAVKLGWLECDAHYGSVSRMSLVSKMEGFIYRGTGAVVGKGLSKASLGCMQ